MDERGLGELFFATGLPEVYLVLAGQSSEELAETAFQVHMQEV